MREDVEQRPADDEESADRPGPLDDGAWAVLAVVPNAKTADELAGLLREARIDSLVVDDARPLPAFARYAAGSDLAEVGKPLAVAVPTEELPVAAGVAERFLDWFVTDAEGEESIADCLAALDEDDDEFAAAVAAERDRQTAREKLSMRLVVVGLLLLPVAIAVLLELTG